jgi:hypothetical protein
MFLGVKWILMDCRVGPAQQAEIVWARGQASYLDTLLLPGRTRATSLNCL